MFGVSNSAKLLLLQLQGSVSSNKELPILSYKKKCSYLTGKSCTNFRISLRALREIHGLNVKKTASIPESTANLFGNKSKRCEVMRGVLFGTLCGSLKVPANTISLDCSFRFSGKGEYSRHVVPLYSGHPSSHGSLAAIERGPLNRGKAIPSTCSLYMEISYPQNNFLTSSLSCSFGQCRCFISLNIGQCRCFSLFL